jgi:prepilin-type N-terminal cleavage/methylation domain-containing protein
MKIKLNPKNKNLKAFTLIELMIVLALISILSTISLGGDTTSMRASNNLLDDTSAIAMDVRDLQNRTASFVKSDSVDNIGYGIFFDLNNNRKTESFYKIHDDDFKLDEVPVSQSTSPIDDYVLNQQDSIKRICINGCSKKSLLPKDDGNGAKVAIYFKKPKPYAYFSFSEDGLNYNSSVGGSSISHVCIEIYNDKLQDSRHIDVYYIGQVAFSADGCSD